MSVLLAPAESAASAVAAESADRGNAVIEFVVLIAVVMLPIVWFLGVSAQQFNQKLFAEQSARYLSREFSVSQLPFERIVESFVNLNPSLRGKHARNFEASVSCVTQCQSESQLWRVEVSYFTHRASAVMYR